MRYHARYFKPIADAIEKFLKENGIRASDYNNHEVVVIVKAPKLVYPVIEYLTTTEGIEPNL